MRDQRVEPGAPLGLVQPGDGLGVGGICGEAIDGLGRDSDEAAFAEDLGGKGNRFGQDRDNRRGHGPAIPPLSGDTNGAFTVFV